jgi:hypothetical protein
MIIKCLQKVFPIPRFAAHRNLQNLQRSSDCLGQPLEGLSNGVASPRKRIFSPQEHDLAATTSLRNPAMGAGAGPCPSFAARRVTPLFILAFALRMFLAKVGKAQDFGGIKIGEEGERVMQRFAKERYFDE